MDKRPLFLTLDEGPTLPAPRAVTLADESGVMSDWLPGALLDLYLRVYAVWERRVAVVERALPLAWHLDRDFCRRVQAHSPELVRAVQADLEAEFDAMAETLGMYDDHGRA